MVFNYIPQSKVYFLRLFLVLHIKIIYICPISIIYCTYGLRKRSKYPEGANKNTICWVFKIDPDDHYGMLEFFSGKNRRTKKTIHMRIGIENN